MCPRRRIRDGARGRLPASTGTAAHPGTSAAASVSTNSIVASVSRSPRRRAVTAATSVSGWLSWSRMPSPRRSGSSCSRPGRPRRRRSRTTWREGRRRVRRPGCAVWASQGHPSWRGPGDAAGEIRVDGALAADCTATRLACASKTSRLDIPGARAHRRKRVDGAGHRVKADDVPPAGPGVSSGRESLPGQRDVRARVIGQRGAAGGQRDRRCLPQWIEEDDDRRSGLVRRARPVVQDRDPRLVRRPDAGMYQP